MRRTLFEVAVAVCAAAVGYLVFALSSGLHTPWRWLLVLLVAIVAFACGSWAVTRLPTSGNADSRAVVGKGLRSGAGVRIEDVEINGSNDATVGQDIKSKTSTTISGIRIGKRRPRS